MLNQDEVITGLEKGHEEGLFSDSDPTEMNGTSMPRHQAAISKQAREAFFHTARNCVNKKAFVAERSCRGKNANRFWKELAKLRQVHGRSLNRSVSV